MSSQPSPTRMAPSQHSCAYWDSVLIGKCFPTLDKTPGDAKGQFDAITVGQASSLRLCQSPELCFLCHLISTFEPVGGVYPFWREVKELDCRVDLGSFVRAYWVMLDFDPKGTGNQARPAHALTMWLGEKIPDLGSFRGPVLWFPGRHEPGMFRPQLVPSDFDSSKAKRWLSHCDERHQNYPCQAPHKRQPKHLIDCQTRMVVSGGGDEPYIALSYVWGQTRASQFADMARNSNEPLGVLPKTFEDAITVTKLLGYRFIWIDMICVDQTNAEEKHDHFSRMDEIYRSANLTMIVAAGLDCDYGIPGVSERPRLPQEHGIIDGIHVCRQIPAPVVELTNSAWGSRGWTFQEGLLSRRRLVFTEHQMFFECSASHSHESTGGFEFVESDEDHDYYEQTRSELETDVVWDTRLQMYNDFGDFNPARPSDFLDKWTTLQFLTELLEQYSEKRLLLRSDVFNAFQAVANVFAKGANPVYTLCGLPFQVGSETSISRSLVQGLLWHESNYIDGARSQGFPTWSWTSLSDSAGIKWPEATITIAAEVVSMVSQDGQEFPCKDLARWWDESGRGLCLGGLMPRTLVISAPKIRQQLWLETRIEERRGPPRLCFDSVVTQGEELSNGVFVVFPGMTSPLGGAMASGGWKAHPDQIRTPTSAQVKKEEEERPKRLRAREQVKRSLEMLLNKVRQGSWKAICMGVPCILLVEESGGMEARRVGLVRFELEFPSSNGSGMYRQDASLHKARFQGFYDEYTEATELHLV